MSPISTRTLDRSQSLELPTETQAQTEAEADTGMEVLEDLCVGVSSLDMTPLLTGAVTSIDQWLDLSTPPPPPSSSSSSISSSSISSTSCLPSSSLGKVRIVCAYEPSDPPPRPGDIFRFTGFVNSLNIYPVPPHQTFRVLGNFRIGEARTITTTTPTLLTTGVGVE